MSFRSRFEYAIDAKGRVNIPSPFREQLQEQGQDSFFITNSFDGCLYGYAASEWSRIEEQLSHASSTDPEIAFFIRFFIGGAVEVVPDKQGRILIPPSLREHAQLEKDVVFTGLTKRFEIWSLARWQEEMGRLGKMRSDPEFVKKISNLGI